MTLLNGRYAAKLFWVCFLLATFFLSFGWGIAFLISFAVYLISGGWRYARAVILTLPRDACGVYILLRLYCRLWVTSSRKHGLRDIFADQVRRRGRQAVAVMHLEHKWTFGDVDDYSNRVANFLLSRGIPHQKNIVLFMETEPKYIGIWLGAAKVGIATGLINSNVRRDALVSCISQLNPQAIIVGASLCQALVEAGVGPAEFSGYGGDIVIFPPAPKVDGTPHDWGSPELASILQFASLEDVMQASSAANPPPPRTQPKLTDVLIYVFTSGTTGLPKAAIITLSRYMFMCSAVFYFCNVRYDDVMYIPLPIYHTAGGIVGVGQMLFFGVSIALRTRFSASRFWSDCIKYSCTVVQYVGETLRYLLAQPYSPEETQHKVRLATGNGVRREVWIDFVKRFGIKQMGEYYGATESNSNLANSQNKVGSLGFTSIILPWAYPVMLVRTDLETGEVMRDPRTGLCILSEYGEVGQLVGRIKRSSPVRNFEGYVNRKETSRKVIQDVKRKGDQYFLSGDLLTMDEFGFFYFVDRLGDTFRWRGENVSTTEVENLVAKEMNFGDCAVYGVRVPENEGRGGMLAVSLHKNAISGASASGPPSAVVANGVGLSNGFVKPSEDMKEEQAPVVEDSKEEESKEIDLLRDLAEVFRIQLPPYARPIFVRFMKALDTTDTFKFKKMNLMKVGFDITATKDRIYYLNTKTNVYARLNSTIYQRILNNQVRF